MTRDERVGQSIYSLIGLILHRNFDQQLTCGGDAVCHGGTGLNLTITNSTSVEKAARELYIVNIKHACIINGKSFTLFKF